MSARKKWFAQSRKGHRYGPHDADFYASWAQDGTLTLKSLVWTEGQTDWLPAEQTELKSLFDNVVLPPPLPHERPVADPQPDTASAEVEESISRTITLETMPPRLEPQLAATAFLTKTLPPRVASIQPKTDAHDLLAGYTGAYGKKPSTNQSNAGSKASGFIGWTVGVILILLAILGAIISVSQTSSNSWIAIPAFALSGVIVLPPVTRSIRAALSFMAPTWAPPLLAFGTFMIVGITTSVMTTSFNNDQSPPSMVSGAPRNAQTEACREEYISSGADPQQFDWSRSYTSDAYPDIEGAVATKIDGQRIKCIIVPEVGVATSYGGCGVFSAQPKKHWVCRMVYDPSQAIWVSTWKARSGR